LSEVIPQEQVDEVVQGYLTSSWEDFVAANKEVVQNFLAQFQQIAEVGPIEDREILLSMIRHESAILRWFDMESGGESERSSYTAYCPRTWRHNIVPLCIGASAKTPRPLSAVSRTV